MWHTLPLYEPTKQGAKLAVFVHPMLPWCQIPFSSNLGSKTKTTKFWVPFSAEESTISAQINNQLMSEHEILDKAFCVEILCFHLTTAVQMSNYSCG